MASLKDVKVKIGGVTKTKQITKAMYMVASAKLRNAQGNIERFRPYADKYQGILEDLSSKVSGSTHPLLQARLEIKKVGIVLLTSDRGLCGSFNMNIITTAAKLALQKQAEGKEVKFYCVGKKGRDSVRKVGYETLSEVVGQMNNIDFRIASGLGSLVIQNFLDGEIDEIFLVYGRFLSVGRQVPVALPLLPINRGAETAAEQEGTETEAKATGNYSYEPDEEVLLAELLPRFVNVQVYRGLLDTSASEHAARMAAMDNATRNCDELVADLTLLYNKTRQAAITTELIDIVGGVEALKG